MTPPVDEKHRDGLEGLANLQRLVGVLRGENGCPWDSKQTPRSLKKYLLEECHELAQAIDSDDVPGICEEIGDVFFILTMLTTMFSEQGKFTAADALEKICDKMVRRHPHVFGDAVATDEHTLRLQWERIKREEKQTPLPPFP